MSRIRPIPKKELYHEVTFEAYSHSDRYGEEYDPPVTMRHVKVDNSLIVKKTTYGDERQIQAVVFIDAKHSKPFVKIPPKSKVTFEGEEWLVNKCDTLYMRPGKVRHYEVELI